jgi:hypothetical protein
MWEFREKDPIDGWIWVEFDRHGYELHQSQRSFETWFSAVADATVHGFDHSRHSFTMREAARGGIPGSPLDRGDAQPPALFDPPTSRLEAVWSGSEE